MLGALMNYIWIATFFATLAAMPMFRARWPMKTALSRYLESSAIRW